MWWQWHCQWHYCISWVKIIKIQCNKTFVVVWCHLHQCWDYIMLKASSVVSLHSLCHNNQNEMQHFGHVMTLASTSNNTDGIINGTITFLRERWPKWGATWLFGQVMLSALVSHDASGIINGNICIPQIKMIDTGYNITFFGHVTPPTLTVASHNANGTTALFRSRQ